MYYLVIKNKTREQNVDLIYSIIEREYLRHCEEDIESKKDNINGYMILEIHNKTDFKIIKSNKDMDAWSFIGKLNKKYGKNINGDLIK